MKKQLIVQATLCALALSSGSVFAAPLSVDNFVPNTPATAASVNDAFGQVETAVNDNDARITANEGAITDNATATAAATAAAAANATAITALETNVTALQSSDCPTNAGDMVRVGSFCVDTYEATVSTDPAGTNVVVDPSALTICTETGNGCSLDAGEPIYARSDAGATPTVNITWFQAAQACANVGKRLITNAEWQTAAAGTPDSATDCNVDTRVVTPNSDSSACISNWGAINMVGNLWELTADFVAGTGGNVANTPNTATYGNDAAIQLQAAFSQSANSANFMAAVIRGGAFSAGTGAGVFATNAQSAPSFHFNTIGFRCAL